ASDPTHAYGLAAFVLTSGGVGVTDLGKTNYAGVAGACWNNATTSAPNSGPGANYALYEGIFTNRSKTRTTSIMDGTSNTLMFGEGFGGSSPGTRDLSWSWVSVGAVPTFVGITNGQTVTNGGT